MKMSEGVEWALHCCLTLAWLGDDAPVPTTTLAAAFDLPQHYLNKFLQALARAGIVISSAGAKGGFRLAKRPDKITLLEVVTAIEGPEGSFRCTEIRRRGAGATAKAQEFIAPCGIAVAMARADAAWRRELASQTIADLAKVAPPTGEERMRCWFATRVR
ncbi:RrF2 family transcriptional regulator [Pigmentiphaga humi]|uniref:RrF2 family transcriptional regulator n=1 Tax=Pigmentiphaga humi TaxID=2478468 RepID=UPI000F5299E4|nr:Rrf2 family transcriptional regulator [Pigmentiphaga humi]